MTVSDPHPLNEAVTQFLTLNSKKNSPEFQQELQKFLRWAGLDREVDQLTPRHIESYCETRGPATTQQLSPLRAFLTHMYKEGYSSANLASHVRAKKAPARGKGQAVAAASFRKAKITKEGFGRAQAELVELQEQRLAVSEDVRKAMADKDFRENAPLDAARDKQAHLEARIRDLEHLLLNAEVDDKASLKAKTKAQIGCRVLVTDLTHEEEVAYHLVHPTEVDPLQGKISVESPAGKAFLNRSAGQVVRVQAPIGTVQYRIEKVEF